MTGNALSPVLSAGYCGVNECSKSPFNTVVPAYYICKAAMIDGVFAPEVATAGFTFEYLQGVCSVRVFPKNEKSTLLVFALSFVTMYFVNTTKDV